MPGPRLIQILPAIIMCLFAFTASAENSKPTADEVKALTLKATEVVRDKGIEEARTEFNKEGEFKYGEIYVNVIDSKGVWVIYPPNVKGVGKDMYDFQDAEGKFVLRDILKVAAENGEGWTEYRWINPVTKLLQLKRTYVKKAVGTDYVVYVGSYE